MSRVHDMGGRFGDGAIDPNEPDEVFPQDWHGRALALTLAAGDWDNGIWTYPAMRGNVCHRRIMHALAIMKNGLRG